MDIFWNSPLKSVVQKDFKPMLRNSDFSARVEAQRGTSAQTTFTVPLDIFPIKILKKAIERAIETIYHCFRTIVYCLLVL